MSRIPFEFQLALRYLRPKRTFVSVITLISVLGVALGVAVLIIVIAVMSGMDQQLRDTVLGFNAHLTVIEPGASVSNYPALLSRAAENPHVKGVAPFIVGQALLETPKRQNGESMFFAPTIRGVDPQAETNVSTLFTNIVDGEFDVRGRGMLIGSVLAHNLGLEVGERVNVYSPADIKLMRDSEGKKIRLTEYQIRGIFDVGYYEYNSAFAIISLENAQDMYDLGDNVHGLLVMLDDPFNAATIRRELGDSLGGEYRVATWLEQSPLLAAVMVEKNMMLYILFFIVVVAAFGITCTLITFIVMKTREIGVLKALGASNRQVMWVFMAQSLIVSLFGIATGIGIGLLAVHYRNDFLRLMRHFTGMELFPASIYGFMELPALIVPGDIAIICGGSLLICLIAAAAPARYASRLNPVEALRYE